MRKRISRTLAVLLGLIGLAVLGYTLVPILTFDLAYDSNLQEEYLSPIPEEKYSLAEDVDFTKASNWFVDDESAADFNSGKIGYYSLDIPKLNIENATVAIGGEDLADSLIQYPGTALPGRNGNAVIFGHSILPRYYDPTDYLAIFSTLPTMSRGDDITLRYDGVTYRYVVEDMFEVKPTDIEILEQNKNGSYITLVTCTPPGDPRRPKRLIVRAKLDPYNDLSLR